MGVSGRTPLPGVERTPALALLGRLLAGHNRFMTIVRSCLVLALLLASCGGSDGPRIDPSGTYTVASTWDASGPLQSGDGLGGLVADALVEEIVAATGVPSAFEEDADKLVRDAIYDRVRDQVNVWAPADLRPESAFIASLLEVLSDVRVSSRWVLVNEGSDGLRGHEVVDALEVSYGGAKVTLSAADFSTGAAVVSVEGDFEATRGRTSFEVEAYPLEVHLDALIEAVVQQLLTASPELDALAQAGADAIACDGLADLVLGADGELGFDVAGVGYSVDAGDFMPLCDALRGRISGQVLGVFRPGTGMTLYGRVQLFDVDGDGVADSLSGDSSFEGEFEGLPGPFDPRVDVTMAGVRDVL